MTSPEPELPAALEPRFLAQLRAGDPRALEECYRVHGARVYRVCRGLLGAGPDAEDATQEVFVKVLERASRLEARDPESLEPTLELRWELPLEMEQALASTSRSFHERAVVLSRRGLAAAER